MAKTKNGGDASSGDGNESRRGASPLRRVVVCGGAGFLGAHLCRRLLREGHAVLCVDNFCTSDEGAIEDLLLDPGFELLRRDVAALRDEELGTPAAIYNLACAASPVHYQRDPLGTLMTSVRGVETLLRVARTSGCPMFQASTSEIYGHPTRHPQTETYWGHVNTFGPRACYDEGKRCAETLCYIYQQQYGVRVRVARIFNTYGPGMSTGDGRVVINFIVQALTDAPITVYGDGRQTRSFCYVDDLLDGIQRLMDPASEFAGPVNLGNPDEITVLELAERIVRLTDSASPILTMPLPVDDPPRRRPDVSLALQRLDWRPRVDLDTGLRLTIQEVRHRMQAGRPLRRAPELESLRRAPLAGATLS